MSDTELLAQVQRELVGEVLGELLEEQRTLEEARQRAQQLAEQEQLAQVRRCNLTAKEKARLVERIGLAAYLALPFDDQPRDHIGQYRRRLV